MSKIDELPRRFCRLCGRVVKHHKPVGDGELREVCLGCGHVHYENPKPIAGAVITKGKAILLCKRAISPRYGYWTLPAGFMERGEHGRAAAARETLEESGARVQDLSLFATYTLVPAQQIYLMYHGKYLESASLPGGEESSEVAFFPPEEIPWSAIAFPTVGEILRQYLRYQAGEILQLPLVGELDVAGGRIQQAWYQNL